MQVDFPNILILYFQNNLVTACFPRNKSRDFPKEIERTLNLFKNQARSFFAEDVRPTFQPKQKSHKQLSKQSKKKFYRN